MVRLSTFLIVIFACIGGYLGFMVRQLWLVGIGLGNDSRSYQWFMRNNFLLTAGLVVAGIGVGVLSSVVLLRILKPRGR